MMEDKTLQSWELMRIKGIPLLVHPSWFLILILFTWTAEAQVSKASGATLPVLYSWSLGFATALLLFLSVLLHELGHSFVAIHEGVKVRSITLFLLGGVAKVDKECPTPLGSFRVAAAGPLVSLILAVFLLRSVQSAFEINPLLANLLGQLGSLNLVLALFNLLPGLPLDGGVMLKAIVWYFTGSHRKGVQVATSTGRALSFLAIILGIWISIRGGGFNGLWLIMLGWFGLAASRSQSQMLALQHILNHIKVKDAFGRQYRVLEQDEPLSRLSEISFKSDQEEHISQWVLVCNSGRWVGYITEKELKDLPVQYWDNHTISEFKKPLNELPSISEKSPLWQAVSALENSKEGRLLVFNLAGLPCGTLDRVDLGCAVLKAMGVNLPNQFIQAAKSQNIYPLGIAFPQVVADMKSIGIVEDEELSRSS